MDVYITQSCQDQLQKSGACICYTQWFSYYSIIIPANLKIKTQGQELWVKPHPLFFFFYQKQYIITNKLTSTLSHKEKHKQVRPFTCHSYSKFQFRSSTTCCVPRNEIHRKFKCKHGFQQQRCSVNTELTALMMAMYAHKTAYSIELRWRVVWQCIGMELTFTKIARRILILHVASPAHVQTLWADWRSWSTGTT